MFAIASGHCQAAVSGEERNDGNMAANGEIRQMAWLAIGVKANNVGGSNQRLAMAAIGNGGMAAAESGENGMAKIA